MDADRVVNLSDLEGLTPDEVIALLDATWPWPLDAVQTWFEDLWNSILSWIHSAVDWIYDRVKPLFDTVWGWLSSWFLWLQSAVSAIVAPVWSWIQGIIAPIISGVGGFFSQVWGWITAAVSLAVSTLEVSFTQIWSWLSAGFAALTTTVGAWFSSLMSNINQFAIGIGQRVSAISNWFSNEFIDPFIDWLIQFPGKLWETLLAGINGLLTRLESWFTHESPGFLHIFGVWWNHICAWIGSQINGLGHDFDLFMELFDKNWQTRPFWYKLIETVEAAVITFLGGWLIKGLIPMIGKALPDLGIWIGLYWEQFLGWLGGLLPAVGAWFMSSFVNLMASGAVLGLAATGKLEGIIDKFVTPAIVGVFDQFEALGPVAPVSGKGMSTSIGKLATFTVSGLAAMTIAGELLSPLKQIGMGNIAAIVYDLINYKTLTAAFMGVLAAIYIKTPLTYYYNRAARPNIPREQALVAMVAERVITPEVYKDNLRWYGYPDDWIDKLTDVSFKSMQPRMLTQLATAGIINDDLVEHVLNHAGYDEYTKPYIKQMMQLTASGALKTASTGTAMTRYQEGFDDEPTLRKNLSALGVADSVLDRYVFAAQLQYLYDYQFDLKAFYVDAYHRRDIEEPELRSDLAAAGLQTDRIDLVVQAQKIKRLAAAAVAADPALTIELETIRARRKKSLITRTQEIEQLITLGYELPYATAIADNDDVVMTPSGAVVAPVVLKAYETEAGKIEVDTIRRSTRARQMSAVDEQAALVALAMPADLAQAIVDNDSLRLVKVAAGS